MSSFRLTPDAQADLIEIQRFTAEEWGTQKSLDYLSQLRITIGLIAESPALGIERRDVGKNVYSFPCESHVLYYIANKKQVIIFGVLHKRMLPIHHLDKRNHR